MSIRAVLFDLDNTLTHRGRSVATFSQDLADTYQSQLNCVDVGKRPLNPIPIF